MRFNVGALKSPEETALLERAVSRTSDTRLVHNRYPTISRNTNDGGDSYKPQVGSRHDPASRLAESRGQYQDQHQSFDAVMRGTSISKSKSKERSEHSATMHKSHSRSIE